MGSSAAARVAVVIPAFNRAELTANCLRSLNRDTSDVELVLVDNGSSDETVDLYRSFDVVVRNRDNFGFGRACNQGAAVSRADVFVFLNNDTEVTDGWLEPLVAAAEQYGVAGSKLVYPDGRIQHAGVRLFKDDGGVLTAENIGRGEPDDGHADDSRTVPAVTGACMAVRRDVFASCRGFDEGYWNGYEDVDLCLTAQRNGAECRYVPESTVVHLESESGPERWTAVAENVKRLNDKWAHGF